AVGLKHPRLETLDFAYEGRPSAPLPLGPEQRDFAHECTPVGVLAPQKAVGHGGRRPYQRRAWSPYFARSADRYRIIETVNSTIICCVSLTEFMRNRHRRRELPSD